MLTIDKAAVLKDARIVSLIASAEAGAKKAEGRSDWLTANELYSRLNMLLEEQGLYKDDVKRETERLTMIRMYAPERFWSLRNNRRNAEIAWKATHKDIQTDAEDERTTTTAADAKARKEAETKPLPPYNAMGDDYQSKLVGIDESMVLNALNRAYHRHVEHTGMDKILHAAIDNVRTMVTTEDLKPVFEGLAKDDARTKMLAFLDTEDAKVDRAGAGAGTSDMLSLVQRMGDVNDQTVKLPRAALMHEFGTGGMMALDEFSAIIWPDEIRRFNRNTQGRFVGVGIQIELDPLWNIRVVTPLDGTPAQKAGVLPGDLIKKIDGKSTEGFTLDQAVDVITGPAETNVNITLERDEGGKKVEIDFPLTRQQIDVATVKGWKRLGAKEDAWDWFIDPDQKIGYVRLTQFADRTDAELDRAIDQMKANGLSALILDLRFNPGGLLDQAVQVVSRFIDHDAAKHNDGMVVTTHTKDNQLVQTEPVLKGKARLAGIPVVVLINEGSASASEIVSGALQDYAKAGDLKVLLLGSRSFGKGSVQNVWPMEMKNSAAAVKVTTQYYHLPAGRMIHRLPGATQWGVDPGLKVEMLPLQITDALLLRTNADVLKLGEKPEAGGDAEPAKPEDLVNKGLDLQLETAMVILESQTSGKTDQAMLQKSKPTANN
jgi:carboxyl-terminal processing protease